MFSYQDIETEFDASLLKLSSIVVRSIRDRTEDGELVEWPEVQFQVTNISNFKLMGLNAEIDYHSASDEFTGNDSDLRLELLAPGETHTFSLIVDPPEQAIRGSLKVEIRRQRLIDRIPFSLKMLFLLFVLAYLFYSDMSD